MSLFQTMAVPCPACGQPIEVNAVSSVNADRRPDLRQEILDGVFQSTTCGNCLVPFRLDPEMTYVDVRRGQWIVVHPFGSIGDWEAREAQARASFDRNYGPAAPRVARELGAGLKPRVTFGWAAAREKIFAAEKGFSDVDLELTKIAVLRNSERAPISANTELRLIDVQGDSLILAWIVAESGEVVERLAVPRALYDEIAADRTGWQSLRSELDGRLFIDMQRLMLPVA